MIIKLFLSCFTEIFVILQSLTDSINATAQAVSAVGVLITLIYLAAQTRISNRNNMLNSFQHIRDSINAFNDAVAQSPDLAAIILKGRKSFKSLSQEEEIRFVHIYGRLLNIIEAWYILLNETKLSEDFKSSQVKNINSLVRHHFSFQGTIEFWEAYKSMYIPELQDVIKSHAKIRDVVAAQQGG